MLSPEGLEDSPFKRNVLMHRPVAKDRSCFSEGPLKKWTEHSQEFQLLKTPGLDGG